MLDNKDVLEIVRRVHQLYLTIVRIYPNVYVIVDMCGIPLKAAVLEIVHYISIR